jgi:hydroxylamine reductase (hybrid-cluster protein)
MYEKYYSQKLHEVYNGKIVNDVQVEEFETEDKHIVKGIKNNKPFMFVLRNADASKISDTIQTLLSHEEKTNKTVKRKSKTNKTNKTDNRKSKRKNKTKKTDNRKNKN